MRIRRLTKVALIAIVAAVAFSGVGSAAISSDSPGVSIIAQNGFGDHNNSYAWSMDWFDGKLYVGTGRDELCIENETLEFYYPLLQEYTTNPSPDVRCDKDPFDLPLQAEIWQYTPQTDHWAMVYRSPTIANPSANGQPVARDMAYRGMTTMTGPGGRQALFAAAVTPDEFIPKLRTSHPPVLLRTYDGVHWTALRMPAVWVHFPTGNFRPMGYRSLLVWRNHLYLTATPDLTGDGGLFEVTNPWSEHPGLVQVSTRNLDIFEIQKFAGALYVGTGNTTTGYGVYKTYGDSGHPFHWIPVMTGGAGRGHTITSVVSMEVYRNRLYVGASGWYNKNTTPASEMIRVAPDGQWTLVVGDPRTLPDGQTLTPTSGLGDGFFDLFNAHFWRMAVQDGGLYVGTNNWSYLVQADTKYSWLQSILAGNLGFDMWATCDGDDWFATTWNAFGTSEYNFGSRTLQTDGPDGNTLYVGSADQVQGTTIYADNDPACGSLINQPGTVAQPAALMTDARTHGTLLSWERAPHAARYEVLQASYTPLALTLQAPPTLPDGWTFDDQNPILVDPGTPGAVQVSLTAPGDFEPVGTTTSSYFIAPTHGRHVYEVVAVSKSGVKSSPSNIQVVPDLAAPATFGALRSTLGPPSAGIARIDGDRARGSGSRLSRLLNDARGDWRRGRHAAALADLRRLQHDAGDNDALAALAARVARNLQYAAVGGGS